MSVERKLTNAEKVLIDACRGLVSAVRAQERSYFERVKPMLMEKHGGKFVLIMGEDLVGVFDDPKVAFQQGLDRLARGAFLVRPIPGPARGRNA